MHTCPQGVTKRCNYICLYLGQVLWYNEEAEKTDSLIMKKMSQNELNVSLYLSKINKWKRTILLWINKNDKHTFEKENEKDNIPFIDDLFVI